MIRALLAGLLLAGAAAPHDRWYLAIAGVAFLYSAIRNEPRMRRVARAWVAYSVMFGFTLAWTEQFSVAGRVALSLGEALILAFPLVLLPKSRDVSTAFAFVAITTLAELVRLRVPWGGLPLGGFSTGSVDAPYASAVAIVGEVGLVAIAGLLAVALVDLRRHTKRVALPFVALAVALPVAASFDFTHPTGHADVATVQGGGPQGLKRAEQRPDRVFDAHLAASDAVAGARFVVWPENVVIVDRRVENTPEAASLASLAQRTNAFVGAGVVERDANARTFNNAFVVWSPEGSIVSRYEKRQRVPFGEYVPMRATFERFADLSQVPYDAIPGSGRATVQMGENEAAVGISYEGLFSRLVASGVDDGGDFVVIPTNAASYENPDVAETQVRGARLRALETGRSVVQSAPTGISLIADRHANVLAISSVGEARALRASIELAEGKTPYVRWGDWPLITLAGATAAWAILCHRRGKRSGRDSGASVEGI